MVRILIGILLKVVGLFLFRNLIPVEIAALLITQKLKLHPQDIFSYLQNTGMAFTFSSNIGNDILLIILL